MAKCLCVICGEEVSDLNSAFVLPLGLMNKELGRRVGVADLTRFLVHAECRPFPYLGTLSRVAESEDRARKSREWDLRLARRHLPNLPKEAVALILKGEWPIYLPKKESLIARERGQTNPQGKKPKEQSKGNDPVGGSITA